MGGVLPCGPDPRDAVTPFEREGARLYFSRGRPVPSADVCGIKDQALSWWILEVALEMGLLKRGTPHFFFFWLAGGQLLLQTISCKWWPFLGGKCMFFYFGALLFSQFSHWTVFGVASWSSQFAAPNIWARKNSSAEFKVVRHGFHSIQKPKVFLAISYALAVWRCFLDIEVSFCGHLLTALCFDQFPLTV